MAHRFQLTLSVSLHAPNDEIRGKIMPINKKWGIDALLTACRDYAAATKRRISFEYAMISGVNDSDACAKELAGRLRGMPVSYTHLDVYKRQAGSGLHLHQGYGRPSDALCHL